MEQAIKKYDTELYKEFLNGDKEAFNERKKLIYFILRYVKNLDVAEDISQDTFVYMLVNKKDYNFKYTLKTYIYTIAKSKAIDYINKHKKEVLLDEKYFYELESETEIDQDLIKEENRREILQSIKFLKIEYQTIIYLKEFEGFKYKEISIILNKTLSQVKITLYRAKRSLKKIMKKEGFIC